jgi:hypothetical protein
MGGPVLAAVSNFTEGLDGLNAFYGALPKAIRDKTWRDAQKNGGHLGVDDKLAALYRNVGAIDLSEAIKNLAKNQAEDAAIAKLSKAGRIPGGGIAKDVTRPGGISGREAEKQRKAKEAREKAIARGRSKEQSANDRALRDWYRKG